jgi:hypothetical protein
MTVKQMRLRWEELDTHTQPVEVVLDSTVIEKVVALMADVLIAVVRPRGSNETEEGADER